MATSVQESIMEIEGIIFSVVHEGKWIGLVCEEWPSLGSNGESLQEAIDMMLETIADARSVFLTKQRHELSEESIRFAEFLRSKSTV